MNWFKLCFLMAGVLLLSSVSAQNKDIKLSYGVKAGVNIGALLGHVDENASGSPLILPAIGVFSQTKLNKKGNFLFRTELQYIGTGVKFEQYVPPTDTIWEQNINGVTYYLPTYYTAEVTGKIKLNYLTLPLNVIWQFSDLASMQLGINVLFLLKGSNTGTAYVIVGNNYSKSYNPFNQSSFLNKIDVGANIGYSLHFTKNVSLNFAANFGILPIQKLTSKVKYPFRNLYFCTQLAWKIN